MNKTLKTIMFYAYLTSVVLAVAIIIFHLGTAEASGCKHHCDETPNTTVIYNDHDDRTKHILQGVVITGALICGTRAVMTGIKENRWTLCGEKRKPEPLPNPGPAVKNDVTPDPVGVRLYQ